MLKLVGDINFTDGFFDTGFGIGTNISKGNDPFRNIDFQKNDVWIGNFECVTSKFSNKNGIYKKQFIIDPRYLSKVSHMNIYNVANNHVMQHGNEAYTDMLDNIKNIGSDYFGTHEKRSVTFVHQGKQCSICGFNLRPENYVERPLYWAMPEFNNIEEEFSLIRSSDFKIVYIHWGNEFMNYPYNDQKYFAHWLIDLGFDLVVGMHPHILQGYEVYKEKFIYYSLGNFLFNMPWYKTHYSVVVSVDLDNKEPVITTNYIKIEQDYTPRFISSDKVPFDCKFEFLNSLLENIPENEKYYKSVFENTKRYRISNYKYIIRNLFKYRFFDIVYILFDFIKRKLLRKL